MSGAQLATYWILVLAICGCGTLMWLRSKDLEYVESRPPGIYRGLLMAYRQMPRWIVPVVVPLCLIGMVAATIAG